MMSVTEFKEFVELSFYRNLLSKDEMSKIVLTLIPTTNYCFSEKDQL